MLKKNKVPVPKQPAKPLAKKGVLPAKKAKSAPVSKIKKKAPVKKAALVKAGTKASNGTKPRAPLSKSARVATSTSKKVPAKKKATPIATKGKFVTDKPVNHSVSKAQAPKKTAKVVKTQTKPIPPVSTPVLHGPDQHLIPVHDKNAPVSAPNPHIAENQFHHNEEVALHQENQKVKANMASRMGRKRIFRIPGR